MSDSDLILPQTEDDVQTTWCTEAGDMARACNSALHESARIYKDPKSRRGAGWTNYSLKSSFQSIRPPLQAFASGGHTSEKSSAYVIWPSSGRQCSSADERAAYFSRLVNAANFDGGRGFPRGRQASTMLDLMNIRAFHSKTQRLHGLGTALGFRTRDGNLTKIPAIIVFVGRKVHSQWLLDGQKLPTTLQGPGGIWCDVDVVEFAYYGPPSLSPKEPLYTELVEGLRGNYSTIGPGSQVASQETYGTLGCIVRSLTPEHLLGFLTNRHVAIDLDYPHQKMFHPLPPNLGPGVYLGAVERATSFITDDLWYGVFAGLNPETFIRADGAFTPFASDFDLSKITAELKGFGEMGDLKRAFLDKPIDSIIGQDVMKVGRSSGLTRGVIRAYAVEYNDEKGICYLTDFLVVGENEQPFDMEGDSGSLILLTGKEHKKIRPFGIVWGGTANRGRLKLSVGRAPENWTSCVDLGRLLDLLQLELITTQSRLEEAIVEHQRIHSRTQNTEAESEDERRLGEYESYGDQEQCSSKAYALHEGVVHLRRARQQVDSQCTPRFAAHDPRALVSSCSSRSGAEESHLSIVPAELLPSSSKKGGEHVDEGKVSPSQDHEFKSAYREEKRRRENP